MKKIIVLLSLMFCLTGCMANYDYAEAFIPTNGYDHAMIKFPDGTIYDGPIDSWLDFDGEQLEITIDGTRYLVNSFYTVLYMEEVDIIVDVPDYSELVIEEPDVVQPQTSGQSTGLFE